MKVLTTNHEATYLFHLQRMLLFFVTLLCRLTIDLFQCCRIFPPTELNVCKIDLPVSSKNLLYWKRYAWLLEFCYNLECSHF